MAQVQGVGQSMHRDGLDKWVGHDDLFAVGRGRIAREGGLDIRG